MEKADWSKKLKEEIKSVRELQKILRLKNPSHPFLEPLLGNAIGSMIDLLAYVDGKNPFYGEFDEAYFKNRQVTMHRTFISDFHIQTEEGLKEIIKGKGFKVSNSSQKHVESIVNKIIEKLGDVSKIQKELREIASLGAKHPSFNDHLESVFTNVSGIKEEYKVAARIYFHGISILRNNVSHPIRIFSDEERKKLTNAKLGKAVDDKGYFVMTFEGYKFLINDIISFFDNVYSNL
jgi:hypothetical protein